LADPTTAALSLFNNLYRVDPSVASLLLGAALSRGGGMPYDRQEFCFGSNPRLPRESRLLAKRANKAMPSGEQAVIPDPLPALFQIVEGEAMSALTVFVLLTAMAVVAAFASGIVSMAHNGEVAHQSSPQWMVWRVVFQAAVFLLILFAILVAS
jgi:hypothetical protein